MDDDLDSGLLNIALSDSEEDKGQAEAEAASSSSQPDERQQSRQDRGAQSEEAFQALKASYRPKVENGELWKIVKLPSNGGSCPAPGARATDTAAAATTTGTATAAAAGTATVTKSEGQALVHALEELYFFRRYEEAARFAGELLADDRAGAGAGAGGLALDRDTRALLGVYEKKCLEKLRGAKTT